MTRKQIRAVLLAFVLVTTAIAGPMTGTVAAQAADTEECGTWDALLYDAFSIGDINLGGEEENPCSAEYAVNQVNEEWNETDAAQTRTHIHSQAGQLAASNEQILTVQENYLKDTETIAFSEGEAAAVETLANGGNVSEAQAAANESIEDYYTIKQKNLIDRWNVVAETVITLNSRAMETSQVDRDLVTLQSTKEQAFFSENEITKRHNSGSVGDDNQVEIINQSGLDSHQSKTLVNGSQQQVRVVYAEYRYYAASSERTDLLKLALEYPLEYQDPHHEDVPPGTAQRVIVRSTENFSSQRINTPEFAKQFAEINNRSESVKQEMAVYINQSLGPAVENGQLNATSYVSSSTLAREYAQDYNGSKSYVRATALAASHGFATPDLQNTAQMTISHDGETFNGLLLSQEAPEDGWQANQVYDPSLMSGIQLFAVSDAGANETGVIELDGSFSIESIQGTNGEEIERANSTQIVYKTSNESGNYTQLQQQIRNLSAQIEDRQQSIGGGGGDGGGGDGAGSSNNLIIGVVLLGGVALVVVGMRGSG